MGTTPTNVNAVVLGIPNLTQLDGQKELFDAYDAHIQMSLIFNDLYSLLLCALPDGNNVD